MKFHAIRSHYPLQVHGVVLEVPNATKCITVDRLGGGIYAWVVSVDQIDCYVNSGFWESETTDGVQVGVLDEMEDYDWTVPLWTESDVDPLKRICCFEYLDILVTTVSNRTELSAEDKQLLIDVIEQAMRAEDQSLSTQIHTPDLLATITVDFKLSMNRLLYGTSTVEQPDLVFYTDTIPFDIIEQMFRPRFIA